MKIVIAGGTGHIGSFMVSYWREKNHQVVVLTRSPKATGEIPWDGVNDGPWMKEVDGADVVLNLAGRTVNCRYTRENLKQMMDSRVYSTAAIGRAIANAQKPPQVWLQMSTATIYAHRFDGANDEYSGIIGGSETDVPAYWKLSIDIAKAWEQTQAQAHTPQTRKVALRTSMVMGRHPESVLGVLRSLTHWGLGGAIAGGGQYVSWIHELDFARAVDFLMDSKEISGAVNVCAPTPIPQKEFMKILRTKVHSAFGLPASAWMIKLGAVFMKTDAELVLKSRRVVPARLQQAGFEFCYEHWEDACDDLLDVGNTSSTTTALGGSLKEKV